MSDRIDTAAARSRELFYGPLCCSESVLLAIAEHQGIDSALVPRMATGFCGGMASLGGPCGALTGAIMGLGLINGRDTGEEPRGAFDDAVRALIADFEQTFGTTSCRSLTHCDLRTEAGKAAFRASGQKERCTEYVMRATRLALTLAENSV